MITASSGALPVKAFSLLGPYAEWMQPELGYRDIWDIGGPMGIDEGYRWNVPVLTYGFDQSFLDYFGTNGVAAVESAINILNSLPPASNIVLSNYPLSSVQVNYGAQYLLDLKSCTLGLLLEHLGLARPIDYIFTLRRWDPAIFKYNVDEIDWPPGTIGDLVLERNFDPETLEPSHIVNGGWYAGWVMDLGERKVVSPRVVDEGSDAVAQLTDCTFGDWGFYYLGLTRDDVGGLRWLLRRANTNYEELLPDVHPVDSYSSSVVNGAWRPGIEKITFVRHPSRPGLGYVPFTNKYTDYYLTDGAVRSQHLERVTIEPDFLFCAGEPRTTNQVGFSFFRSGTDTWQNNAIPNWNNPSKLGPGTIQPPVRITFDKSGEMLRTEDGKSTVSVYPLGWGSYDGTTNSPIAYPNADSKLSPVFSMQLRLYRERLWGTYEFHLPIGIGDKAILQGSSNLVDWVSWQVITNTGSVVSWLHKIGEGTQNFLRVVPERR